MRGHPQCIERGGISSRLCIPALRKVYDYLGALANIAFDEKLSAMSFDDAFDEIKAQARSAGPFTVFPAVIRLPHPRQFIRCDAIAIINDRDTNRTCVRRDVDRNRRIE